MPDNVTPSHDDIAPASQPGLSGRSVHAVFLPNVRMGPRRIALVEEGGPNPAREACGFKQYGVKQIERDLHTFPWNPLAKKGTLLAGLDLLRALKVLLFDRRADVIVSVFESNVFFVLMLRKLFRFKPKIALWEVSGRGWRIRDKILDYVVPRVDQVFVLTEAQRIKVEATYRLRNPAQLLGFAIDDEFFRPTSRGNDDQGFVLAVGDDVSRDYPTLIEACRLAGLPLKLRSNAKFKMPVDASHVSFVGRLSYKELRDLYERATIVVVPLQPVDYPGGITAIYEAMAMAKPLVASRTSMTASFITHRESGVFVDPEDVIGMSKELLALWNDKPARDALGAGARQQLERHFSYDRYIHRFATLLRQTAGR
jgi:glycosyltransferase involved in cell wall biosynthesis